MHERHRSNNLPGLLETPKENSDIDSGKESINPDLPALHQVGISEIDTALTQLDVSMTSAVDALLKVGVQPCTAAYDELIALSGKRILNFLEQIQTAPDQQVIDESIRTINSLETALYRFNEQQLEKLEEGFRDAIGQWNEAWQLNLDELPEIVKRSLTADDLTVQQSDDKSLRSAKRKLKWYGLRSKAVLRVPVRDILSHYRNIESKPLFHQALGNLSLLNHRLIGLLRKEAGRQLKLLVFSLDKVDPNDRIKMLEKRASDFNARLKVIESEAAQFSALLNVEIKSAMRNALNSAAGHMGRVDARIAHDRREKRVNESALEMLNKRLEAYPTVWKQNQTAFHEQLLSDLRLGKVSLQLFRLSRTTRNRVHREYFEPLEDNISQLERGLNELRSGLKKQEQVEELEPIRINDQLFLNTEALISHLETATDSFAQTLPETSRLLHGDDVTKPMAYTRQLRTVTISLNRIADYLIKTNFTENHRQELLRIGGQLKRMNNRLINTANLIAYSLEIASEEKHYRGLQEVLEKSESEILAIKGEIENTKATFNQQLKDDQNNTLAELDIKSVVARADQLKQYVTREPVTTPLNKWLAKRLQRLQGLRNQLRRFIVERRHDVLVARFQEKHETIVNEGERIQDFIDALRIDPEIDRKLPYYYKQLFSGKHLSNAAGVRIRQKEIDLAKTAIDRIQRGAGGAIAIIGDAMTGKTFLLNYIAGNIIQGKVYRIQCPTGGSHNEADLHQAFMRACGKETGSVNSTLASLEPGSVIVINDLEQWWLKHPDGNGAVNALSRLIERFSRRHYFLLTCNSFSFRLISQSIGLDNYLASTIVISPATQDQMRDIIWMRHSTGGLVVESAGKRVEQLLGGYWDNLITRFYKRSNGNVGLSLHFWLRSIDEVQGDTIRIKDKGLMSFPELTNNNWKVIIYQLFMHRSLSISRLKQIFEDEDTSWLRQNLGALVRIGLVVETGRLTYGLNGMVRPYIERWFTEINLID